MLPQQRRVKKKNFSFLIKNSKSFSFTNFNFKVNFSNNNKPACFSCVVSSKDYSKAVDRNLIKRRCRAIIKEYLPSFKNGYTCLIYFKKGILNVKYSEMKKEMFNALSKIRIIKDA